MRPLVERICRKLCGPGMILSRRCIKERDATDYKLDDQYRLSEITYSQNGKNWKVVYGGYDTKTQPAMPANMELTDGGQRIKLKMDNWIVK